MNKKLFYFFLLFTLIVIFPCCTSIKNIEYQKLEVLKIEKINLTETQMQVSLSCYNPNNLGVEIKSSILDIYLNGSKIGSSEQTQTIKISKKSTFKSSLSVNINLKKTILNLGLGLLNQDFDLKIKGTVRLRKGLLVKNLPVEISKKLKLDLLH
jgi:LEA14-like dessication related protein